MIGRRVVVTGLGMVTPVGLTVNETWGNILAGKSGAAAIDSFDVSAYSTQFSASVKNFDVDAYLPPKDSRKQDVFVQFGMVAGIQAMEDSGLEVTEENAARIGCSIGSGIGGIGQIEKNSEIIRESGPRKISPFFFLCSIINMISGNLSVKYNLQGPNLAVVTACTSGTHNIGLGARLIALGDADAMLVGGAEMATTPVGLGGFAAARALSLRASGSARIAAVTSARACPAVNLPPRSQSCTSTGKVRRRSRFAMWLRLFESPSASFSCVCPNRSMSCR